MEIVTSATGEYDVKHDVIIQQQFTLATKIGSMTSEHSLHQQPGCLAYAAYAARLCTFPSVYCTCLVRLMMQDLATRIVATCMLQVNFQLSYQLKKAQSTELHCL